MYVVRNYTHSDFVVVAQYIIYIHAKFEMKNYLDSGLSGDNKTIQNKQTFIFLSLGVVIMSRHSHSTVQNKIFYFIIFPAKKVAKSWFLNFFQPLLFSFTHN